MVYKTISAEYLAGLGRLVGKSRLGTENSRSPREVHAKLHLRVAMIFADREKVRLLIGQPIATHLKDYSLSAHSDYSATSRSCNKLRMYLRHIESCWWIRRLDLYLFFLWLQFNRKRAGGGGGIRPPRHFLLYLSLLLFFRAETSWLFFFKPCARFKTI